jgi:hypothetical protein
MTVRVGPLPAGDERHLKALEEASDHPMFDAQDIIATYFLELHRQGVRLVDASEVAEWLRENLHPRHKVEDAFPRRFGGGDEAAPPLNEAGGYGATVDDLGSGDGSE